MSLKLVHVLFIAIATLMAAGVGLWSVGAWRADGASGWLALAAIAFIGGGILVVYGTRFLQKFRKLGIAGLLMAGSLAWPHDALACPACVGTTESALQSGMNMGIFALLGVIGFVAVSFAAFFVYLALRARRTATSSAPLRAAFIIPEGSL